MSETRQDIKNQLRYMRETRYIYLNGKFKISLEEYNKRILTMKEMLKYK